MTIQNKQHETLDAARSESLPMSNARVLLVFALLAFLLGGHALCVLINKEFWPLSHYPMYAMVHRDVWTEELMVGVQVGDPAQEIKISSFAFDRPISVRASIQAVSRELVKDPSKSDQLHQILYGLGNNYRDLQGGNRPKTYKEINAVRLYRVIWNVVIVDGEHRAVEASRELIMEVDLDSKPSSGLGEV